MSPRARLLIAIVSTMLVGYTLVGAWPGRVAGDTTYGQLSVFNEVIHLIDQSYVEPVNMDRALTTADMGLTEALDGDSSYLDDVAFKTYQEPLANSADAESGATLTRRYAFLTIVACRPNSPCEKAGLRAGDIIKTIDGKHTRSIPAPVGERLLRGAPGSVVKLAVFRGRTEPVEISVVRERLVPQPVQGRKLEQGPGYVRVPDFDAQTASEVRGQLDSLKRDGVKTLVLDVRDVATGDMDSATKVAELFMKGGLVAKLSGRKATEKNWNADPSKQAWDGPLALLVDTGTSGPAEVMAAALQEAGRAQLVGERTFGRAAVQKAIPLPQGGLILTVAKYSSPKGNAIHGKGVEPTVPVKSAVPTEDDDETPENEAVTKPATDPILDKAIDVLLHPEEVKPAKAAA